MQSIVFGPYMLLGSTGRANLGPLISRPISCGVQRHCPPNVVGYIISVVDNLCIILSATVSQT